jgi:predicted O-linked N-acetylglucosamine transferase (SPINDLY family)
MLDPIHFGGGNTTYEFLAMGTPVVTLPSALLRCRLAYAMYCQVEMLDLVADGPEGYVDLAVRLGTEKDFNDLIYKKISETCGVLYGDPASVRDLEEALVRMVETVPD